MRTHCARNVEDVRSLSAVDRHKLHRPAEPAGSAGATAEHHGALGRSSVEAETRHCGVRLIPCCD